MSIKNANMSAGNTLTNITDMGGGMLGRLFSSWPAMVFYYVKGLLIAPIYSVIETASPLKGITSPIDKAIDLTAWDTLARR